MSPVPAASNDQKSMPNSSHFRGKELIDSSGFIIPRKSKELPARNSKFPEHAHSHVSHISNISIFKLSQSHTMPNPSIHRSIDRSLVNYVNSGGFRDGHGEEEHDHRHQGLTEISHETVKPGETPKHGGLEMSGRWFLNWRMIRSCKFLVF